MVGEYRAVPRDELDRICGEELPERVAISLISAGLAIPVNPSLAASVLLDGNMSYADTFEQLPAEEKT